MWAMIQPALGCSAQKLHDRNLEALEMRYHQALGFAAVAYWFSARRRCVSSRCSVLMGLELILVALANHLMRLGINNEERQSIWKC